ncbi:MAG: hemerythrin domain-containing protein, partial [Terracidiphilus sp.]
ELLRVQSLFAAFSQEMTLHMMKEEQILFPYIVKMEVAVTRKRRSLPARFGTVRGPVAMMMVEHESSGRMFEKMREITGNYLCPSDARVSYQTLYQALPAFEEDLHQHIHLENNILFPRSVELDQGLF